MRVISNWLGFDALGNANLLKRLIIFLIGVPMWIRFYYRLNTHIKGTRHLAKLDDKNVLFISNHQTYFAETALFFIIFSHLQLGIFNKINRGYALLFPKVNLFYVAAAETMKSGLLPRIFKQVGAVTVERTWREKGKDVKREVNPKNTAQIEKALANGWVITFPQGTTKSYSPVRKGTAHIIRENQPVVVPIRVDGFRRAFDKKGLLIKKKGVDITVEFLSPITFSSNQSVEFITSEITEVLKQNSEEELFWKKDMTLNT